MCWSKEATSPSDGASLLLMTSQFSGPGAQAEKVAWESAGRIRLSRAPRIKYKHQLPNGVQSIYQAIEYLRRVAKQTDNSLVRAVACERDFFWGAMRILYARYAPPGKGSSLPVIRPEGS